MQTLDAREIPCKVRVQYSRKITGPQIPRRHFVRVWFSGGCKLQLATPNLAFLRPEPIRWNDAMPLQVCAWDRPVETVSGTAAGRLSSTRAAGQDVVSS